MALWVPRKTLAVVAAGGYATAFWLFSEYPHGGCFGGAMVDWPPGSAAALPGRWQQREQSASAPCTTKAQQAKAISVRQWKFDAKKPSRRAQAGLADLSWVYVSFPDIAIQRTCRFQPRRHDDPGELHTGALRTTSRHGDPTHAFQRGSVLRRD